ncbi:hypothetical protein AVEN_271994-1 [Araneus ventricosus]|uniref:Uncharacterized protein n=1 Tax=Araneus ventricosus TaxID=182803 RepID=A0A4Y2CD66_ARAVE|nr:hypothetical protein AVEN_271994-1 [Araneus ventricosus]
MIFTTITNERAKSAGRRLKYKILKYEKDMALEIERELLQENQLTIWKIYEFHRGLLIASFGTLLTYGILIGTLEQENVLRGCKRGIHRCSNLEFFELGQFLKMVGFQRTQNPKLHLPIPIWNLDERVAGEQRICLHWDLSSRLELKPEIPNVREE